MASMRDSHFVPIERMQDARVVDAFAQFSKAALLCEAYFGPATAKPFHEILKARNRVVTAAQMLLRTFGGNVDPMLRSKWEAEIWAGAQNPDDIAAAVEGGSQEIETMLRPLLAVRSGSG